MKRERVKKFFNKPSLTRQEFKMECDLQQIIRKFGKTPEGRLALQDISNARGGSYLDVSAVPDYRTAKDIILKAEEHFMALPAVLRRRFDNDPALFLDYVKDPANLPEMRALGLAKPELVKEADASVSPAG